ncbi:carbohydrate ABC transporter permease [Alicyclobacillus sp. SO9]|uniref:carbohydrate ABC transporter permease n=1 Tax=Alicyclobacillus sp. SO9 TaxID=2665646 RepID=UPI0018E7BAA7|nr:sugar ABC transporter permease [Alicyclobacillus sp. SO9]QQE78721.1 sugar ABC transporter permease [Alicyclobacillus sp. SO9]
MRRSLPFYLMALPAALLFFLFHTYAALKGIYYSFTNWHGFGIMHFVGLKNYINLFQDPQVLHSYLFTIKFAVVTVIFTNIISLVIALGLNANVKVRQTLRAVYFLPNILSVIVVSYIFNYIFAYLAPSTAKHLGFTALAQNILGSPQYAWVGIAIVAVWQAVAFNTILYLAGLQTIPSDIYEASSIDGASTWRQFWRITFPLIAPFFTINMVLASTQFLQVFDQIVALTGGGPGDATESITWLIYNNGFNGGQFAYQSSNAVVFMIVLVMIAIIQVRFLQKREVQM